MGNIMLLVMRAANYTSIVAIVTNEDLKLAVGAQPDRVLNPGAVSPALVYAATQSANQSTIGAFG